MGNLVLSRKLGESIQIGDGVSVKVVRIRGKAVRLAIEAPESVKILRGEHLVTAAGTQLSEHKRDAS